jgi:hypothetical protein
MKSRVRTTVTLDPDVAAKVRALARKRGISFTEALNSTLQRGLAGGSGRRYRLSSRQLGLRPGVDLEHAMRLAAELEDADRIRGLDRRA